MVEHKALSLGDGGELNELIMQRNGKEWEWMERFKGVGVDEHRDQAEFLEGGQQPGMSFYFIFFSSADFPTPLPRGWEQPRKWRGSSETRGAGRARSRWRSCGCGLPGAQRAHCAGALNGAGLCAGGLARISLLSHELQKNARIWGICHQGAGCAGCEVTGAFPGLPQSLGTRVTLILPVYIVNASAARLKQGRGKYASQCGHS